MDEEGEMSVGAREQGSRGAGERDGEGARERLCTSAQKAPLHRRHPKGGKLRIKWVKSSIGYSKRQKATIKALGLKRLGDVVEHNDTPVIRGMIYKVRHLVKVEKMEG